MEITIVIIQKKIEEINFLRNRFNSLTDHRRYVYFILTIYLVIKHGQN